MWKEKIPEAKDKHRCEGCAATVGAEKAKIVGVSFPDCVTELTNRNFRTRFFLEQSPSQTRRDQIRIKGQQSVINIPSLQHTHTLLTSLPSTRTLWIPVAWCEYRFHLVDIGPYAYLTSRGIPYPSPAPTRPFIQHASNRKDLRLPGHRWWQWR